MKKNIVVTSVEVLGAYQAARFIPTDKLLKAWNKPVLGGSLIAAGVMFKQKDVLCVGIGVLANGLFSFVGL